MENLSITTYTTETQESVYYDQEIFLHDLSLQYLNSNIPKAFKLGIYLENPNIWNLIPATYHKDFLFYIATIICFTELSMKKFCWIMMNLDVMHAY